MHELEDHGDVGVEEPERRGGVGVKELVEEPRGLGQGVGRGVEGGQAGGGGGGGVARFVAPIVGAAAAGSR